MENCKIIIAAYTLNKRARYYAMFYTMKISASCFQIIYSETAAAAAAAVAADVTSPSSRAVPSEPCSYCRRCLCNHHPELRSVAPARPLSKPTRSLCRRLQDPVSNQIRRRLHEAVAPRGGTQIDDLPFSSFLTSSLIFSRSSGSVGSPLELGILSI